MARKQRRTTDAPEKIKEGINKIRDFYEQGQRLLADPPRLDTVTHDKSGRKRKALPREIASYVTGRQRIQVASPERGGFTQSEINQFCARCERTKFAAGKTHLVILMTVPRKDRPTLITQLFRERWSGRVLRQQVTKRYGARRRGGRRRRVATERADVLTQLLAELERWQRLNRALSHKVGPADEPPVEALTKEIRDQLSKANRQLKALQDLVAAELDTEVPTRLRGESR